MRLCVVSSKDCWQDDSGQWVSYGGFPHQMAAVASLFDHTTLVVLEGRPRPGGTPLPPDARIVALRMPKGADLRRKFSMLAGLPYYIGRIAREMEPGAVVHTPLPGDLPLLGLWLALFRGRRCIGRYGGCWTPNGETTFMNRVTRAGMRLAARGHVMIATGDDVTPPAPAMSWLYATALSARELDTAPIDVGRGLARPARLVYLGRLSREKGVDVLLRAVARLREEGVDPMPQLTIAGDGPERSALEALARARGCAPHVQFAGQLDRSQLRALLCGADLCVQPSRSESLSKAWLDAMAFGVPVLSARVGAAPVAIGERTERGWLFEPENPAALAGKLLEALRAPIDWPALRRRCQLYVRTRTLECWTERIAQLCAERWGLRLENGRLR